jgi:hypothetical protein
MGSKDDPVPSQHQGVLDESQGTRLPTKVSFKGGSHLGNLNPTFFLSSPISGTRFLLRVVVCNIPRFYQILGEIFLLLFCLNWLKIYKNLKLFELMKSFIRKLFQTFYNFEELLWENQISKYYFPISLFKHMQAFLAKEWISKVFIKGVFFKTKMKSDFQLLSFRYHSSIFKENYFQILIQILLCKKVLLAMFIKFYWKTYLNLKSSFITGWKLCVEY